MARPRSPLFILYLTVFIDLVGFGIIIPVLPLYAEHFHASPIAIGWLTGIYSGMQIIFTPILGKLSDRFGRRPVLIVSIAGTAIGFALMGWPLRFLSFSSREFWLGSPAATFQFRKLISPMSPLPSSAPARWA